MIDYMNLHLGRTRESLNQHKSLVKNADLHSTNVIFTPFCISFWTCFIKFLHYDLLKFEIP